LGFTGTLASESMLFIGQDLTVSPVKSGYKPLDFTNMHVYFIRRNLRDCTKPVKAAAYTTMARPTLEYTSTVLDPHSSAET
jgi:hypothetical protein